MLLPPRPLQEIDVSSFCFGGVDGDHQVSSRSVGLLNDFYLVRREFSAIRIILPKFVDNTIQVSSVETYGAAIFSDLSHNGPSTNLETNLVSNFNLFR